VKKHKSVGEIIFWAGILIPQNILSHVLLKRKSADSKYMPKSTSCFKGTRNIRAPGNSKSCVSTQKLNRKAGQFPLPIVG